MKVAIIPGHHPVAQGANGHDFTEWAYNYTLAKMIHNHLRFPDNLVAEVIFRPSPNYSEAMKELQGKLKHFDLALEFHCNSSHGNATGREIWVHEFTSTTNIEIAQILLFSIGRVFDNKSRGVKKAGPSSRGYKFLNLRGPFCQIIEPGFLSNKNESRKLLDLQSDYALKIAQTLKEIAEVWKE